NILIFFIMKTNFLVVGLFLMTFSLVSFMNVPINRVSQKSDKIKFTNADYNTLKAKWPINGCKDFTVGVNLGIFYVETTITHCCVHAVCAPAEAWNLFNRID